MSRADPSGPASPPRRNGRIRTLVLVAGLLDLALAGFILAFGRETLRLERQIAWYLAALLAASAVGVIFIATLGFDGRERTDQRVIRRH